VLVCYELSFVTGRFALPRTSNSGFMAFRLMEVLFSYIWARPESHCSRRPFIGHNPSMKRDVLAENRHIGGFQPCCVVPFLRN
jgi:hypothetical protein